jgi:hypothetical protein
VPPGKTQQIIFAGAISDAGEYLVEIGNLKGKLLVISDIKSSTSSTASDQTPLPDFQLSELNIKPLVAKPGEKIIVSCMVTNTGALLDGYVAELKLNGKLVASQTVFVASGKKQYIEFDGDFDNMGEHIVEIGNLKGIITIKK